MQFNVMKLLLLGLLALCAAASATEVAKVDDNAIDVFEAPAPVNADMEIAKQGLQAARDFIAIFHSGIFKNSIQVVAEIVSKVFSFVLSILKLFGLGGESAELQFMRQQFREVNAKLDGISLQLDDVKRLVEWQTTRVMYANYEQFILLTSSLFDEYLAANSEGLRELLKRQFVAAFERNTLAPLKLYQAIVEIDFVISQNLAAAVVHYTQNHRRHVMNFLLAMQRLIMRGAQLQIAYEQLKHGDQAAAFTKSLWDGRILKLLTRMKQVETDVKSRFQAQVIADAERVILENRGLINKNFVDVMFRFLAEKYDWRHWFSLAYKDVTGFNMHTIHHCGGYHKFRTHGSRNVVVASADPGMSRFTVARANAALDAAEREGSGTNAESWYHLLRRKVGQSCEDAAFVGAVCWGCDVWFIGHRFVYRKMTKNGDINTLLFG